MITPFFEADFLKMYPIFVNSSQIFGKRYENKQKFINQGSNVLHLKCLSWNSNFESHLLGLAFVSFSLVHFKISFCDIFLALAEYLAKWHESSSENSGGHAVFWWKSFRVIKLQEPSINFLWVFQKVEIFALSIISQRIHNWSNRGPMK